MALRIRSFVPSLSLRWLTMATHGSSPIGVADAQAHAKRSRWSSSTKEGRASDITRVSWGYSILQIEPLEAYVLTTMLSKKRARQTQRHFVHSLSIRDMLTET